MSDPTIHGADEAGGVAGGQLQIVCTQPLFVIGVTMEEHIGDGVAFSPLENRFDAGLFV